jgi:hypothetical protein
MNPFTQMLRARSGFAANSPLMRATRGGFARPDPKPYGTYKYTRRYHLQDMNTVLYSDFAPEFYMHLHSIWVQHSRQGIALWLAYFAMIVVPVWSFMVYLQKKTGAGLYPSLRPGGDHDHMLPRLAAHLKANNCETRDDLFGRKPASFYRNWVRQEKTAPKVITRMRDHGFNM